VKALRKYSKERDGVLANRLLRRESDLKNWAAGREEGEVGLEGSLAEAAGKEGACFSPALIVSIMCTRK